MFRLEGVIIKLYLEPHVVLNIAWWCVLRAIFRTTCGSKYSLMMTPSSYI